MSKELKAFENIMRIYGETNSLEGTYNDFLTIKKALQRLEDIDNAKPSEALECLEYLYEALKQEYLDDNSKKLSMYDEKVLNTIKNYILKAQEDKKKADALKELIKNHIEFVVEEDRCYFKIKNSKGNEKSFTSCTMLDFWKEVLEDDKR